MYRLLIVEDDIIICEGIKTFLSRKGYDVDCAYSLAEARQALESSYHLIVLDINLADGSGMDLCKEIRKEGNTPVIFLTANDTEQDMMEGFLAGCDDYIAKPFSIELLNQRIAAVLRRSEGTPNHDIFSYEGLTVDFKRMSVSVQESAVRLSATEYKLLELLIKNKGYVLTRKMILEKIWDCDENYVDENTLNVHIRRLRKKIETDPKNPKYIVTVFGIGYTFGENG